MNLILNHLYSKNLNIYGDLGNIMAINFRANLANINLRIINTEIGDELKEADIYFVGGGQDKDQLLVYKDLLKHKDFISKEVDKDKVFLLICGGYQLFGKKFVDGESNSIEGLGILDLETKAPDYNVISRCIGNIVVKLNKDFVKGWGIDTNFSDYLVGFENHGGQTTFLSNGLKSLGNALHGFGNNSLDKMEGVYYKNIIGSYLHGSLLPKNPHLTDAILKKALATKGVWKEFERKYTEEETRAHFFIQKKFES